MALSLASVRDGIKTRLETITGLRAHDTVPDVINIPCAIVGYPERIEYDAAFGRGRDRMIVPVRVYATRANDRTGQDKLDGYLAGTGAGSVKSAIEGDVTLGGASSSCRVTEARGYGAYMIGQVDYLGVEFLLDIIG